MYKPKGIFFNVALFSLNWGKCANLAKVVMHPRIQHSSACIGTLDCWNSTLLFGSMPHANNVAVIFNILARNSLGS